MTQEYVVELLNTDSDDQHNTNETIDEVIADVRSEVNKEERLYDEPELVCKEANRKGNTK